MHPPMPGDGPAANGPSGPPCGTGIRGAGPKAPDGADGSPAYTVYLLRCEDGSFYTGITTDIGRRLAEHLSRGPKAARYTRTHPVAALEATWEAAGRAEASRLEYRIKRLTHGQKAELARNPQLAERLLEAWDRTPRE